MIEEDIGEEAHKKGINMAVAESCTGGLLSHRITNVAGSSAYYKGSVIAYSNEAKERILGVSKRVLEEEGAISEECAVEMAKGVKKIFQAHIGISTTGIAGPDRIESLPDKNKPVGLVYMALATKEDIYKEEYIFHENREGNKKEATAAALEMLKKYLMRARSSER